MRTLIRLRSTVEGQLGVLLRCVCVCVCVCVCLIALVFAPGGHSWTILASRFVSADIILSLMNMMA